MIASFGNRANMLDKFDPRAGKFHINTWSKFEDKPSVGLGLELEPCDQKELTKSLHYGETTFTGMSCIKDKNNEVLQGLMFDPNRKSINIDFTTC